MLQFSICRRRLNTDAAQRERAIPDCIMRLHEWLYRLVYEICYDREYVYFCYARHFSELTKQIFEQGRFSENGAYEIPGMKSGKRALLRWQLAHGMDLMRLNTVTIRCTIEDTDTGKNEPEMSQTFELSCGESTLTGPVE